MKTPKCAILALRTAPVTIGTATFSRNTESNAQKITEAVKKIVENLPR